MPTLVDQHIEISPEKFGGKPCVRGTRIRVWDIYVLHEQLGKTADEVVAAYPELSLGQVHAALSYYYDHKAEIDAQMKADDEFVEQLRRHSPPSLLCEKLNSADQNGDHLSP